MTCVKWLIKGIERIMIQKITIEDKWNELQKLDEYAQKLTNVLLEIVKDDQVWWTENLKLLASQPLDSLKTHLASLQDTRLSAWTFSEKGEEKYSILGPVEALVWLVGLCRLDRTLIGALPREFVDQIESEWKVLALYWV